MHEIHETFSHKKQKHFVLQFPVISHEVKFFTPIDILYSHVYFWDNHTT